MNKYLGLWLGGLFVIAVVAGVVWYTLPRTVVAPPVSTNQPPPSEVQVFEPTANAVVVSPLAVYGRAPGNWFFEASLPVVLTDETGKELAHQPAQAQSDWMVTTPVEFRTSLTFTPPASGTGYLVVKNDNPSGLPQLDKSYQVKVRFK